MVAPVVVAAIKDEDDDVDVEDCVATPVIKQEMNVSQASSCDYSLSQFNANESQFVGVKREESDDDNDAEDDAAPPLNHSHANNTSIKRDLDHATDDAREVSICVETTLEVCAQIQFHPIRPNAPRWSPTRRTRTTFRFQLVRR